MAIRVSKTHTWTVDPNRRYITPSANAQPQIWVQKNGLVACGAVVRRSCSYDPVLLTWSAGPGDGWAAPENVRSPSGAFKAWAIITLSTGMELLLTSVGSAGQVAHTVSPGGLFTDGAVDSVPTAIDGLAFSDTTAWQHSNISGSLLNTMVSDQGSIIEVQFNLGLLVRTQIIAKLESPHASLEGGYIRMGIESVAMTHANLCRLSSTKAFIGGVEVDVRFTCEGLNGLGLAEVWNSPDVDGDYPCCEANTLCVTPGSLARLGKLPDFYFGSSSGINPGDTYSSATDVKQFMQVGHILVPWDGVSVPVLS